MIDPDYQGEIGLLLYSGVKETKSGIQEVFWGYFLVLPFRVVKVSGNLQQLIKGRMINASDLSRVKFRVMLPGEEPRAANRVWSFVLQFGSFFFFF